MDKTSEVKGFWDSQAITYGSSSLATMPDQYLKMLEIENISKYLKNGMSIIDIGCGNGYSTFCYAQALSINIQGVDYSEPMIRQANKTLNDVPKNVRERTSFRVGDVRHIGMDDSMLDTVITDRCLINLVSRDDQLTALKEIHRVLKPQGLYLMCEDTEQGLNKLNSLREYVGLDLIKVRWHNLYLDEKHILSATKELFELVKVINFSSFYYLASRIINGKIAQEQGNEPKYDCDINRVAALCSSLDFFGDCGPLKLFVFRKKPCEN